MEIQQALVRAHYLAIEPDGKWDAATEAAMQKYQADNGWQTKLMPDSRAIVKLGLGPDYSNAINAKNSSFAAPPPASYTSLAQSAGFVEASGISH
jgi:peptidoglycan hydrolase-like protein with peptidoglycan-binding domain